MIKFQNCKLCLTLVAQSPMIHFQGDSEGATLRGSELKPKLDRFLNGKIRELHDKGEIDKKSRELQCLYALTDYIDCDALADTCEENLDEVEELMKDEEKAAIAKMRIGEERQETLYVAEDIQDKVG